jgi:hypothetical protein
MDCQASALSFVHSVNPVNVYGREANMQLQYDEEDAPLVVRERISQGTRYFEVFIQGHIEKTEFFSEEDFTSLCMGLDICGACQIIPYTHMQ